MTAAVRARIRTALRGVPAAERESHLTAVTALLDLVARCREGREPRVFTAGPRLYNSPAIHWAAGVLGHVVVPCPDCVGPPDHLTMFTRRVRVRGRAGRGGRAVP
jgi:hypothetical protein